MKRLADELISDIRTVVIARVDVIDSARDRLAQDRECALPIFRRPKHAGTGKLHGAVTHPPHGSSAQSVPVGIIHVALAQNRRKNAKTWR